MSDLRRKTFDFEVKSLDDAGTFEVYAAVFGNLDRQREIIEQGAVKNLDAFVRDGWGALNHDWQALPVALVADATQDATGLRVAGAFHTHQAAQDCRTVVRERKAAGKSVKCSIGFRVLDAATEVRDGEAVTILKAIEIFEFSFVNLPANPLAGVVSAKGGLISLDDALGLVRKEGRTLSRSNVSTVRGWAKRCREAADEMDGLAAAFDRDAPAEAPPGGKAVPDHASLRLRAARLRSRTLAAPR